ncbi:uncharacterized protein TNIN_154812 [Trichonephila inaurata madagascariensis]|uniref:Uncharacterized protein n=1 Tax=Trichonephila inaurata madagascariensis TaxID=2747483 RepID=A0A8X6IDZ3_9ARAC|nr:uncharacterized protein TNIN_154812 [Trichonephila inaurata madagascariensis]
MRQFSISMANWCFPPHCFRSDTVYLLLPAPAARSSYATPHVGYDWRNRRRRRRYEGYAEYAVIPEKTNYSSNREEKDRSRKLGSNTHSGRNDYHSTHSKTMTSFSEAPAYSPEIQKRMQETNAKRLEEQIPVSKNMGLPQAEKNENVQESQNFKSRKSREVCGVHTTRTPERKYQNNLNDSTEISLIKSQSISKDSECVSDSVVPNTNELVYSQTLQEKEKEEISEQMKRKNIPDPLQTSTASEKDPEKKASVEIGTAFQSEQTVLNINALPENPLRNFTEKTEEKDLLDSIQSRDSNVNSRKIIASSSSLSVTDGSHRQENKETEKYNPIKDLSSSPLPDILSSVHKTVPADAKAPNNEIMNNEKPSVNTLSDKIPLTNDKFSKSRIILSQSPYSSYSMNSDSSSHDIDTELKGITTLQSLRANQAIYKLAYDESITDQSESDSRSLSPADPESQVPRSITNDEIIIHEADSGSEAGSEDVELIPHRYESETFLNENKHMYVNKLSLAVELLRTQESLPYDEEFKRISGDNNLYQNESNPTGEVNLGFVEDSSSFDSSEGQIDSRVTNPSSQIVTSQAQANKHFSTKGANSSFSIEDSCNESCEEAKEVIVEGANNRICTMCSVS